MTDVRSTPLDPELDHGPELRALREAAAVVDQASAGRLFISGADALDLLNRLTTNELEYLPSGTATSTVITNGDGRVVDLVALGALDDGLWCLTSPGYAQTVVDWLDLYTFAEEIAVDDRTESAFQFTLSGPFAATVLAQIGVGATLASDELVRTSVGDASVVLWRRMAGGADGYELIGEVAGRDAVLAALVRAGALRVSADAWEGYRITNGMPAIDAEFGLFNNPLEARLLGAISETKGCYTGQEVIARLQTYAKVQRRLMAVELYAPVAVGTTLEADGKRVGEITSVVATDAGASGLALVASKAAIAGAALTAGGEYAVLREPAYALATEPRE